MKEFEEQINEKKQAIADLSVECINCCAIAMNKDLPQDERDKNSLRAYMIQHIDIPMALSTPLQRKEFPKGGFEIVGETGPELFITKKP